MSNPQVPLLGILVAELAVVSTMKHGINGNCTRGACCSSSSLY